MFQVLRVAHLVAKLGFQKVPKVEKCLIFSKFWPTYPLLLFKVTGFQVDIACLVIFLVCIFYTSVGGMKAVMWTDTFQVHQYVQ